MLQALSNGLWCQPRRLWRDEQGASLLEMTIVVPCLLAIGFGVMEFGNALYQYHMVTAGVRDAARYLGSSGYVDLDDDHAADADEVDPDGTKKMYAKRIAVCGDVTDCTTNDDKRVSWWPDDIANINSAIKVKYCLNGVAEGDTIDECACESPALTPNFQANKVCVSTTPTYSGLGFLGYFGLGPITIKAGHEQRYFGIR